MKKMPVAMTLALTLVSMIGMVQPLYADAPAHAESPAIEQVASPRATILTKTKKLYFSDSVVLEVTYTVNDGYNIITGIKKVRDKTTSAAISNLSWTYKQGLNNKSYVFTATYYKSGSGWKSSTNTLYA